MIQTAVILAAGLGSRLNGRTASMPKGFLPVGDTTLIERSLHALATAGIRKVFFGTGYRSRFYENLCGTVPLLEMHCVKSGRYRETGSFYTLVNMKDSIAEDFLLLESDLIYEPRALASVLEDHRDDLVLVSGPTNSGDEVFVEADGAGRLLNLSKDENDLTDITGELVGISRVSSGQYRRLCRLAAEDKELLISGHYETAFARLSRISPFWVKKVDDLIWAEVDTEVHLRRVNTLILPRLKELK